MRSAIERFDCSSKYHEFANAEYVKWVVPPRLKVVRQTETPTVNRV